MNKTRQLFELAISYWPETISVKDKTLFDNGGARIPALTKVHDAVEESILSQKDNYSLRQMDWAIFTVLHDMAKTTDLLKLSELDFKMVEEVYAENTN